MIPAHRIEYRGYSSVDFDLITCLSFESDDGEVNSFLTREAVASESYRGEFKRIHNFKYTETFNPKFTFIKDGFGDFTTEEIRKVLRWLTGCSNASFLTVFRDDSNADGFEILGGFSEVSLYKIGNGRCVGFVATFESAHPYAFSPLYTYTQSVMNTPHQKFTIDVDSDEEESAIYPRITIQQNSSIIVYVDHAMIADDKWINNEEWLDGVVYYYAEATDGPTWYYQRHYEETDTNGNTIYKSVPTATKIDPVTEDTKTGVIIRNTYADDNGVSHVATLRIANNTANEKVILDGANRVVSSSATSRIFGDSFNWEWLPLYNGKNTIEVIGNCTVTFEYRTVVKCGEM